MRLTSDKIAYNNRIVLIKRMTKTSDIVIIQVYFPTTEANDDDIKKMYTGL